jgi:hypothetical protein
MLFGSHAKPIEKCNSYITHVDRLASDGLSGLTANHLFNDSCCAETLVLRAPDAPVGSAAQRLEKRV